MPVTLGGVGRWEHPFTCISCGKPSVAQASDVYTLGQREFRIRCPLCQEQQRVSANDLPESVRHRAPAGGDNRRHPEHRRD